MIFISKLWFKITGNERNVFSDFHKELVSGENSFELNIADLKFTELVPVLNDAGNPVVVNAGLDNEYIKCNPVTVPNNITGTLTFNVNLKDDKVSSSSNSSTPDLILLGYDLDAVRTGYVSKEK